MTSTPVRRGERLLSRLGLAGAILVAPLTACNVDVADPEIVQPDQLESAENAPLLLGGAIADFGLALTGNNGGSDGIILIGGMRADEFGSSDTFESRFDVDRGVIGIDNDRVIIVYRNLHLARAAAERAARVYSVVLPDDPGRSEALSIAGFTYVYFAENFCAGTPFTEVNEDGSFDYGAGETTEEIFQRAIARFNEALTLATALTPDPDDDDAVEEKALLQNLARVGLGRAHLGLGDHAAAVAAVASVPDDFVYLIERSVATGRQNNGVYVFNRESFRYTASNNEGTNGLDFGDANDPRVVVDTARTATGGVRLGVDNETPLLFQFEYNDYGDDVVLASGLEARLIEAEAALESGNYATPATGTLAILNALRADSSMVALAPAVGAAAQEDQLFRERAFWLYLTGHRLGDLRRLVNQYDRAIASVFPTGTYEKLGSPYGTEINLPVPEDELNNPNFTGCVNRNM